MEIVSNSLSESLCLSMRYVEHVATEKWGSPTLRLLNY